MKKFAVLLALIVAAVALVACGSSSSTTSETTAEESTPAQSGGGEEKGGEEGGGGSASSVKIEANPEGSLEFVQKSVTAEAGKVNLEFTNESPVPHDVKIEGSGGEEIGGTEVISEGSDSAEVNLKPGTYHFYCSIPGHREAGMEGTLTVK